MALQITFNTPASSNSGTLLSSAYVLFHAPIPQTQDRINVTMLIYESEAAYDAGRDTILIDEIPNELLTITFALTGTQYGNIDMNAVHDDMLDILKEGSAAPKYPIGADQSWSGLEGIDPLNTVVKDMPV